MTTSPRPRRQLEHIKVRAALQRLSAGDPRRRCRAAPSPLLLKAIHEFNAGEFFDQHETLEDMWRAETDEIRFLYQGILHVGVGFYHLQKGNFHGAVTKLGTGTQLLTHFEPSCMRVDVRRLVAEASAAREQLIGLGEARMSEFDPRLIPHVHLRPSRSRSEVGHS
jgi:predicted metal-dependent hydrolase